MGSPASDPPPRAGQPSSLVDEVNERLTTWATPDNIDRVRESCIFSILSHGGMGFVFGGLLGMFLSGMASTGPEANLLHPAASATTATPFRVQAKQVLGEMGSRTWRSAKSFGKIAALFTGFECVVETYRAKHDITNTLAAGCMTGGVLAAKGGPKAALLGCAGFAAFSAAIEHFLQERPPDD